MSASEIRERVLNWQGGKDRTALSDLLQELHDAAIEDAAQMLDRAARRNPIKSEKGLLELAACEVRTLKGSWVEMRGLDPTKP